MLPLVEVWRQLPLSRHACFCRQLHFLLLSLTVAFLLLNAIKYALVVVVYDPFRIVNAAVVYLDGVSVEYFTELVVCREAFVY